MVERDKNRCNRYTPLLKTQIFWCTANGWSELSHWVRHSVQGNRSHTWLLAEVGLQKVHLIILTNEEETRCEWSTAVSRQASAAASSGSCHHPQWSIDTHCSLSLFWPTSEALLLADLSAANEESISFVEMHKLLFSEWPLISQMLLVRDKLRKDQRSRVKD